MKPSLIHAELEWDPSADTHKYCLKFDDGPDKTGRRDGLGFSPDFRASEDALVAICSEHGYEIDRNRIAQGPNFHQNPGEDPLIARRKTRVEWNRD